MSNLAKTVDGNVSTEPTRLCCPLPQNEKDATWVKFCWGWEDFNQLENPASSDPSYLAGWKQAKNVSNQFPGRR